jgi:hypothetical protein
VSDELDDLQRMVLLSLKAQGFTVKRSRNGHQVVTWADDGLITILPGNSTYRGWRNSIEALKGRGFVWPPWRRRHMHQDE